MQVIQDLKAVLHRLVDGRPLSEVEQTGAHDVIERLDQLAELLHKVTDPPPSAPAAEVPAIPAAEDQAPAADDHPGV